MTPRLILEPMTLAARRGGLPRRPRGARGDRRREDPRGVAGPRPRRAGVQRVARGDPRRSRDAPLGRSVDDHARAATERLVIGSIIFHGRPGELAAWPRWATASRRAGRARASRPRARAPPSSGRSLSRACGSSRRRRRPGIRASIRVLEKSGLVRVGTEEHETLGEVLRFERASSAIALRRRIARFFVFERCAFLGSPTRSG